MDDDDTLRAPPGGADMYVARISTAAVPIFAMREKARVYVEARVEHDAALHVRRSLVEVLRARGGRATAKLHGCLSMEFHLADAASDVVKANVLNEVALAVRGGSAHEDLGELLKDALHKEAVTVEIKERAKHAFLGAIEENIEWLADSLGAPIFGGGPP